MAVTTAIRRPVRRSKRARALAGTARGLMATAAVGTLLAGCADFPDAQPQQWREQPTLQPETGPKPYVEGQAEPPPPRVARPDKPPAKPKGCQDPDPAVVATCLAPIGAIAVLPSGHGALVGERTTGRILRVRDGQKPELIATVPVDASAGGGLTGLTLSPSYAEDQLVYAYVTTATDNRVVRIAEGEPPEAILKGIPKGSSGNRGAITADGRGALLVATGNAGNPAAANDPGSLAGKVLRINAFGDPAAGNPDPNSRIVSSGLRAPGDLCATPGGSAYWVTDHTEDKDVLHRIRLGEPVGAPAWSWDDKPGVSGCVATRSLLVVALTDAEAIYTLQPARGGVFTGEPQMTMKDTYGRFSAAALGPKGLLWLGTANKAGGTPVSSDDRVIKITPPAGGSAGKE